MGWSPAGRELGSLRGNAEASSSESPYRTHPGLVVLRGEVTARLQPRWPKSLRATQKSGPRSSIAPLARCATGVTPRRAAPRRRYCVAEIR